jgi:hypothetical protein
MKGALANLGHHIDKITVRHILRRHDIDPAPKWCAGSMTLSGSNREIFGAKG